MIVILLLNIHGIIFSRIPTQLLIDELKLIFEMAGPKQKCPAPPFTAPPVQLFDSPHCLHIADFAQVPLSGGQIRMQQQNI
jgi:hypothetical protein